MRERLVAGRPFSVLLGNGFSRACRDQEFQYSTLFAAADFGQRADLIRQIFAALETEDFEKVTGKLQAAADLLGVYGQTQELRQQLVADAEAIKNALVAAIAHTHPARPADLTLDEYVHVRRFLSGFDRIYTVNYDLLMYWARNQDDIEPQNWSTDDGFRANQRWVGPDTEQQVFFLHGALHLYQHESGVRKRAFANDGTPIIDIVRRALRRNVFPLFVSEPTSALKRERINSNPYLSYCLRRLSQETGAFLIFGHQLADVDAHIVNTLDRSNVTQIFVSLFGDENSQGNRSIRATALAQLSRPGRDVEFVNATTVPVWRDA